MRGALLPALLAVYTEAACRCNEDYPYCWSSGTGHDNKCYKSSTSNEASSKECTYNGRGRCTESSGPTGPTPQPTPTPTLAPGETPPPCDLRKSGQEYCDDFCNYRCAFYNTSKGETGKPQQITVIRITPKNVTGPADKNTADAPGDVNFVLSKKNITQVCLHDPRQLGCNTDVEFNDLYGTFILEIDGQWGPYQACNPADGWDTADWRCGQNCFHPTHENGCEVPSNYKRNGTSQYDGQPNCWCDRTARSVGREPAPKSYHHSSSPSSWPPQCTQGGYQPASTGYCINGTVAKTLTAWDFASASTMACKECLDDAECGGWAIRDGWSVDLFHGKVSSHRCSEKSEEGRSASVYTDRHTGKYYKSKSWNGVGDIDGVWYSHRSEGECPPGKPLGTNGCTWRVVKTLPYKNATCVDEKADAAVEQYGKKCFDTCPKPLNRFTDCYLDCYRNTLLGDASLNISKPPPSLIVDPWRAALEDSNANGGCADVKPGPLGPGLAAGGRMIKLA